VHASHGLEHHVRIQYGVVCSALDLMCQYIKQHFGIGVRIDMAQVLPEHFLLELSRVGQITVVTEHNAKW